MQINLNLYENARSVLAMCRAGQGYPEVNSWLSELLFAAGLDAR